MLGIDAYQQKLINERLVEKAHIRAYGRSLSPTTIRYNRILVNDLTIVAIHRGIVVGWILVAYNLDEGRFYIISVYVDKRYSSSSVLFKLTCFAAKSWLKHKDTVPIYIKRNTFNHTHFISRFIKETDKPQLGVIDYEEVEKWHNKCKKRIKEEI